MITSEGSLLGEILEKGLAIGVEELTFDQPTDLAVITVPNSYYTKELMEEIMQSWEDLWRKREMLPPLVLVVPEGFKVTVKDINELISNGSP